LAGGAVHLRRSLASSSRDRFSEADSAGALLRASPAIHQALRAGAWVGLACLTRYEAWGAAIAAAAAILALNAADRSTWLKTIRLSAAFLAGPALAVGAFLAYSVWSTGSALFLHGVGQHRFPLPPSATRGLLLSLVGLVLEFGWIGLVALGVGAVAIALRRNRETWLIAVFLAAPLVWSVVALSYGLGFRPRYLLGALPFLAVGWAMVAARLRPAARRALTALVVLQALVPLYPVSDAVASAGRWVSGFSGSRAEQLSRTLADSCASRILTPRPRALFLPWQDHAVLLEACATNLGGGVDDRVARALRSHDDGEAILAPMADLAGWMFTTGLPLSRFIHEGNWPEYELALLEPRAHAGWVALRVGSQLEETLGPRLENAPEFIRVVRAIDSSGYGVVLYWRVAGPLLADLTLSDSFPYHDRVSQDRVERFQKLLVANPDNILVRFSLCQAYFDAGRYEDAIPEFRRVLEEKQDWILAYLLLGRSLLETGRGEEARPVLEAGIELAETQGHEGPLAELRALLSNVPRA
jgi:tetratricopeptide (TPR) repeat protein